MSVSDIESQVLALAPKEASEFAAWFDEHREELTGEDSQHGGLDEAQQDEILRRRDAAIQYPGQLLPWDGTIAATRQRLHEIRHQKTA